MKTRLTLSRKPPPGGPAPGGPSLGLTMASVRHPVDHQLLDGIDLRVHALVPAPERPLGQPTGARTQPAAPRGVLGELAQGRGDRLWLAGLEEDAGLAVPD